MFTLLFAVILIIYVGLGVPDSLFGAAWPAISADLGLSVSIGSLVPFIIACGTVASSLMSSRLINRFGTAVVTIVSTLLTALALLGLSFVGGFVWICVLALPLGVGAGCIDAALNNYAALNFKASQMSFLHCFYGIGVAVSPFLMSLAIGSTGWRTGYRWAFYLQIGIALCSLLSLPLWRKVGGKTAEDDAPRSLGFGELMRTPGVGTMMMVFFGACAVEWSCGGWASTYLVLVRGFTAEKAAATLSFYYIGLASGRFVSGLVAKWLYGFKQITVALVIIAASIPTLYVPYGGTMGVTLFFIGFGVGPLFPVLSHLTPKNFGRDISQSVMGVQMAAANLGVMIAPPLCGLLIGKIDARLFPVYLLLMTAIAASFLLVFGRKTAKSVQKRQ